MRHLKRPLVTRFQGPICTGRSYLASREVSEVRRAIEKHGDTHGPRHLVLEPGSRSRLIEQYWRPGGDLQRALLLHSRYGCNSSLLPYLVFLMTCCVLRIDRLGAFAHDISVAIMDCRERDLFFCSLAARDGLRDDYLVHGLKPTTRRSLNTHEHALKEDLYLAYRGFLIASTGLGRDPVGLKGRPRGTCPCPS